MKTRIGIVLIILALMIGCGVQQSAQRNFEIVPIAEAIAQTQAPLCVTATSVPLCVLTPTPLAQVTNTAAPTLTPTATNTATVQPTATQIVITPTQIATSIPSVTVVPTQSPNLFRNGEFEAPYVNKLHPDGNYHIVADGWSGFYCDECDASLLNNPEEGLLMGRPEYKPAAANGQAGRDWRSGRNGQQWFCFFRVCQAGVYQTVSVAGGSTCEVSAWVRSWANSDDDPSSDGDFYTSEWWIRIDPLGGTFWDADHVRRSPTFGGSYDTWTLIEWEFTTPKNSNKVTVFFENTRKWAIPNNDSYIDAATLRCD
jgi:hypothetical protein